MPSFSSLPQAIVKVLTLSIGELDYQSVMYDEGLLLYKGVTMIAFGIFVVFITVVLINFLVGLATDDIKVSRIVAFTFTCFIACNGCQTVQRKTFQRREVFVTTV
jgi:Flp pilus assembly pilin Flp